MDLLLSTLAKSLFWSALMLLPRVSVGFLTGFGTDFCLVRVECGVCWTDDLGWVFVADDPAVVVAFFVILIDDELEDVEGVRDFLRGVTVFVEEVLVLDVEGFEGPGVGSTGVVMDFLDVAGRASVMVRSSSTSFCVIIPGPSLAIVSVE